uniref:UBA domain-containing protein n=1 Tax=Globodera pallida TaxID=36090 RepID=A0A183BP47_GLOPA
MKIIIEKLKPFSAEITDECQRVISNMKNAGDTTKFTSGLDMMTEWCSTFGKTEMGRWADVLNDGDAILDAALEEDQNGTFAIDRDDTLEAPVLSVLRFTSLLFENTFSRSIYASMERLIKLLDCRKMWVLVQVLRVLMIISKSSRFISQHLTQEMRTKLYTKLMAILEAWSGRLRTMPVNEFCSENYTVSPATLSIQIRSDVPGYTVNLDKSIVKSIGEMRASFASITLDDAEMALASFKLRFAYASKNLSERFYLVMTRLIVTSVFFYSRCLITEEWRLNSLANDGFIEHCCAILSQRVVRQSVTHLQMRSNGGAQNAGQCRLLEKDKKIQMIVDHLELRTYHGFLPSQIRSCIESLKAGKVDVGSSSDCSIAFVTSLFSLVYHIAGFEYGGDALNRSSMTAVLLDVVKNYTLSEQNISFVTRSMRIIDNLTGMDITEFNARGGTDIVIKRLIHEVDKCNQAATPLLCNQQRSALMKSLLNFLKRAVLDVHLVTQMRRIMETELPMSLIHIIENPHFYGPSLLHCAVTLTTNFIFQEPAQLTTLQNTGLTSAIMGLIFNEKSPLMLQSNYLHMLANILRYTHRHDVDKAFLHLVKQNSVELKAYNQCETSGDVSCQKKLCQLTRLCALLTTLNSLMVISCNSAEQQQQQATTSQIIEDTAKVSELLIDDESASQQGVLLMEVDNSGTVASSTNTAAHQQQHQRRNVVNIARSNSGTAATMALTTTTPTTLLANAAATSSLTDGRLVERSAQSIAIRSLKQIAELITYIGKAFCTISLPRIRQRGQAAQPTMDQATMRQHAQKITKLVFGGLKRLLEIDDTTLKMVNKINMSASHIHLSLSTLKKLLIDDTHNLQLLLPNFYKSGCHSAFFAMGDKYLRPNIEKVEYNMPIQLWLGITQRLIVVQLADMTNRNKTNGQQPKPQQVIVEGFESNNYLATCQKDAFAALVKLFKSLVELCDVSTKCGKEEGVVFVLLERVLCSMKVLVHGMMELLELTEDKAGHAEEIPVSEIDPTKIEQLVEMGFSQSDAVDALMQFSSVLEAAEHIVSMMERSTAATSRTETTTVITSAQPTVTVSSTAPATTVAAATTVATDVVAAATASVISAENSADQQQDDEDSAAADTATPMEEGQSQLHSSTPEADASTSTTAEAGEDQEEAVVREEFQEMVDLLCREVVGTCLRLVRCSRLVVIGLSELVSVFARDALASSWVDVQFIGSIITELNRHLDELTTTNSDEGEPMMAPSDEDKEGDVGTDDDELAEQLASLLQLFCQLWQHFPNQKIYKRLNE